MYSHLDKLGFSVIIIGLDGQYDTELNQPCIKQVNVNAVKLLGYTDTELTGKPLASIYPDGNNPGLLLSDTRVQGEVVSKAGLHIPVLLAFSGLLSGKQHNKIDIALIIEAFDDSNDRVQHSCQGIESALSESEERFQQMAEIAGEWLWEQDPKGYYIYSSVAVKQILGYSQSEVIGKHYTQFLSAKDQTSQQLYAHSQRPFYRLINHYRHKDGRRILTESTGLPIIDTAGNLLKWRGIDRDITAQKHFQDAVIENEKRIRLILESSINAVVIMDAHSKITDWNPQAEKMFGWAASEAIGFTLDELIIPVRFRESFRQGLTVFLQTGICPLLNRTFEHIALRRDGAEFPVEVSVSPLKLGKTYIFSGFIHDISARKAAEQQIHQAQIELTITQSEFKIAQKIQASLLPSMPIKSTYFEVVGLCLPADKVGGDYFDYFYRDQARLDMVIADVSGHSIGPALFMVEARSSIRTLANRSGSASDILSFLNNFLYEDLNKTDYFITMFYLQYDTVTQQLSFADAGHSPPLLLRFGQTECQMLDADGLILGIREDIVFEQKTIRLGAGDLLLIYTDGLTEAENLDGEFFGSRRLTEAFIRYAHHAPKDIIAEILAELKAFCQKELFKDDITLMVFRRI